MRERFRDFPRTIVKKTKRIVVLTGEAFQQLYEIDQGIDTPVKKNNEKR